MKTHCLPRAKAKQQKWAYRQDRPSPARSAKKKRLKAEAKAKAGAGAIPAPSTTPAPTPAPASPICPRRRPRHNQLQDLEHAKTKNFDVYFVVSLEIAQTVMAKAASKINRRAAVTMLATILVVVAVLLTILVVDAAYLVAVNRGMQDVSSIMALAGAPELLDPNLLLDAAGPPTPDQAAARTAAASLADAYRQRNNAILPSLQRVDAGDVVMQTGFVDDVTANPPLLDLAATEHNTLFVYSVRATNGEHPVSYPVDLAGTTRTIEIRGGAFATLDNLLVGFRPESEMAAPLMPLGILSTSWSSERTQDSNGNGINEMVIRLQSANPPSSSQYPPQPNGALLFYGGSVTPDVLTQTMPQQVVWDCFLRTCLPADRSGRQHPPCPCPYWGRAWATAPIRARRPSSPRLPRSSGKNGFFRSCSRSPAQSPVAAGASSRLKALWPARSLAPP